MRSIVTLLVLTLAEVANADVLPCRAHRATAYDIDPAPVRYAAQTGRVLFGAVLGVPIGLTLAIVGVPIGAATGPLWVSGEQPVAEGALWGICPGLLTLGIFADAGYYILGGPAHGIWRVAARSDASSEKALTEPLQPTRAVDSNGQQESVVSGPRG